MRCAQIFVGTLPSVALMTFLQVRVHLPIHFFPHGSAVRVCVCVGVSEGLAHLADVRSSACFLAMKFELPSHLFVLSCVFDFMTFPFSPIFPGFRREKGGGGAEGGRQMGDAKRDWV